MYRLCPWVNRIIAIWVIVGWMGVTRSRLDTARIWTVLFNSHLSPSPTSKNESHSDICGISWNNRYIFLWIFMFVIGRINRKKVQKPNKIHYIWCLCPSPLYIYKMNGVYVYLKRLVSTGCCLAFFCLQSTKSFTCFSINLRLMYMTLYEFLQPILTCIFRLLSAKVLLLN